MEYYLLKIYRIPKKIFHNIENIKTLINIERKKSIIFKNLEKKIRIQEFF